MGCGIATLEQRHYPLQAVPRIFLGTACSIFRTMVVIMWNPNSV